MPGTLSPRPLPPQIRRATFTRAGVEPDLRRLHSSRPRGSHPQAPPQGQRADRRARPRARTDTSPTSRHRPRGRARDCGWPVSPGYCPIRPHDPSVTGGSALIPRPGARQSLAHPRRRHAHRIEPAQRRCPVSERSADDGSPRLPARGPPLGQDGEVHRRCSASDSTASEARRPAAGPIKASLGLARSAPPILPRREIRYAEGHLARLVPRMQRERAALCWRRLGGVANRRHRGEGDSTSGRCHLLPSQQPIAA